MTKGNLCSNQIEVVAIASVYSIPGHMDDAMWHIYAHTSLIYACQIFGLNGKGSVITNSPKSIVLCIHIFII